MNIDRVLIVLNTRNFRAYGRKITDETPALMAVEEFFEDKGIAVSTDTVERIADEVLTGHKSLYAEKYCFEIVDVFS